MGNGKLMRGEMRDYSFQNDAPCRIKFINPIGISDYDAPMADLLAKIKRPETEIELVSLAMSAPTSHVEYRTYEAMVVADTIKIVRDAAQSGFDGAVIGCFYDPALEDAREISGDMVVVGPCQASCQILANLCNKFSILVGRHKWIEQMHDRVRQYGYEKYLASFRSLEMGVDDFQKDTCFTEKRILETARRAVEEDHAEGIILGCTCEFGFFQHVQKELGVPVIDAVFASFKMAEYLAGLKAQLGWRPSRQWSCQPPPEEEIKRFGLFNEPPPVGNIVRVR